MYHTDLTETEWQYIIKVLNLQARKRKYDLRVDLERYILLGQDRLSMAYVSP